MRKIRLEVEDLHVESFSTAEPRGEWGTVRAYRDVGIDHEEFADGSDNTCPPVNTCNQTHCGGYSCEWTKCAGDGCKNEQDVAGQIGANAGFGTL